METISFIRFLFLYFVFHLPISLSANTIQKEENNKIPAQTIQVCTDTQVLPVSNQPGDQVSNFFGGIFSTIHWPARWYCGEWSDFHGWFSILSDFFVWLSYFAIPAILFFFLHKKTVPKEFRKIFWLFIAFIMCCGMTHLMEVIIFWWPAYRLSTLISFFTAVVSSATVFTLVKAIPSTLKYKSPDELQRLIDEKTYQLEEKTKDLEEINKELKHFAFVSAHDLKAPLANIESLVQILKGKKSDKIKDNELFDRINKTILQSRDKIEALNDILEIKSLEHYNPVATNVIQSLNGTIDSIDELIKESEVTIITDIDKDIKLPVPKVYLSTIFQNLITNAIKYRKALENPVIQLRSRLTPDQTIIEIEDNGRGIDLEAYGNKFFGLFQRFHLDVSGKGVGLYITKSLVENFGGSIEVDSKVDVGTTIRIIFPSSSSTSLYEEAKENIIN